MKKIVLCCNAGMSTSLLVQKMQAEAKKRGIDTEIVAYPMTEVTEHKDEVGCLLLGPQVSYFKAEAEKLFPDVQVSVINMMDYGRMNAAKIIDDALKMLG